MSKKPNDRPPRETVVYCKPSKDKDGNDVEVWFAIVPIRGPESESPCAPPAPSVR